jgi:hypothetical protein
MSHPSFFEYQSSMQIPRYFAFAGYPLTPRPYRWVVFRKGKMPRIVWETFWHYLNPMTYIDTVRYIWQRGTRGYADCDWWNLNCYIATVNLGVLRMLRDRAHGYPADLATDNPLNNTIQAICWSDQEDTNEGFNEWKRILDKMILGFEAYLQLANDTEFAPEECWGDRTDWDCDDADAFLEKLNDPNRKGFDRELYEQWRKPLQEQMDEGFALYAKHFHNLWD